MHPHTEISGGAGFFRTDGATEVLVSLKSRLCSRTEGISQPVHRELKEDSIMAHNDQTNVRLTRQFYMILSLQSD